MTPVGTEPLHLVFEVLLCSNRNTIILPITGFDHKSELQDQKSCSHHLWGRADVHLFISFIEILGILGRIEGALGMAITLHKCELDAKTRIFAMMNLMGCNIKI